jgi:hypothetical protein
MEMREGMGQRLTNYGELLRDGKAKIWQLFVIWSSNILALSIPDEVYSTTKKRVLHTRCYIYVFIFIISIPFLIN